MTAQRSAVRAMAAMRSADRGEHDSTGAAVIKRFTNVPEPARHDPYRDSFKTRTFGRTDTWR